MGTTQFFADHIYLTTDVWNTPIQGREWKIIITTIKENKFDTYDNPGLLSYATTIILKFKLK